MNIAARIFALALFFLVATTSDAETASDGSVTVRGAVVSFEPNKATPPTYYILTIKTLDGVVLEFEEPEPVAHAERTLQSKEMDEKKAAQDEQNAEKSKQAAEARASSTGATDTDKKAAEEAKQRAAAAVEAHKKAQDETTAARAALEAAKKAPYPVAIPASLRVDELIEATYNSKVHPSDRGRVVNALTKPIRKIGDTLQGIVTEISADNARMVVRTHYPDQKDAKKEQNVALQMPLSLQPVVAAMRKGDAVNATYITSGSPTNGNVIRNAQSVEWQSKSIPLIQRCVGLLVGVGILFALTYLFTNRKPASLIIGGDDRYSTSKFQTALWFWLVIGAYIAIVSIRMWNADWTYVGGVDIPLNLAALSGISVLTFTSAKFITIGKIETASEKGQALKEKSPDGPKIGDLIRNDGGKIDLGDFQMLVITILAVVVYAFSVIEFMETIELRRKVTMPDVDATVLAIFGLGQLAYLGKKVAGEGLSPTEIAFASKASSDAAAAVKTEADNAENGAQTAKTKAQEAKTAHEAAIRAQTRAAAEPEVKKANDAARIARDAANKASTSSRLADLKAADAKKIVDGWVRHPDIDALTAASTVALGDADRARAAATTANVKAGEAEKSAEDAQNALNGKSS